MTPPNQPTSLAPEAEEARANQAIYLVMIVVLALANLPYLWCALFDHQEYAFSGIVFDFSYFDAMSYLTKMRAGFEGAWLYENRYTTEEHQPVLLFMFYIVLGHLARLTGLSLVAMYHLARVGCAIGLFFGIDRFLRAMTLQPRVRVLAFVLALTASGFGWIARIVNPDVLPPEYKYPEAFVFQSLLNYSHFALSTALLVFALGSLYLCSRGRASPGRLAVIALAGFAQAWVHPRLILTALAVGAMAGAWQWRGDRAAAKRWAIGLAVLLAASLPVMAATLISVRADPLWAEWSATPTLSPPPLRYLLGYGLLIPLGVWGAFIAIRERRPWAPMLVAWVVIGAILPYLPMAAQRRMIQGWNIPLAILSAYAIGRALIPRLASMQWFKPPVQVAFTFLLVLVMALSGLWQVALGAGVAVKGSYPAYISDSRAGALEWLRKNTRPEATVLSTEHTGMFIPALAGNRVVAGHWAETWHAPEKRGDIARFFRADTPGEWREAFLDHHGVKLLFFSQVERLQGRGPGGVYNPGEDPASWRQVAAWPEVVIYERME